MSVDFTKKGAEGLQWVHANLQQSRSVDEMMERGRNAFWIVNQSISDGVKELSQMISKNYYQSGDDLVLFFNEYKRNTKILDKLLEVLHYPQVSGLRVVFFRGQLNRSSGDLLRDAGEVFLKQYRSDLDWKLARNSQDDIITFVEVENTHSGILKKVFYRVINKELESEIEKWHESFPSDIEFVKI
jgi:hypothetical protein